MAFDFYYELMNGLFNLTEPSTCPSFEYQSLFIQTAASSFSVSTTTIDTTTQTRKPFEPQRLLA
jgi:hypothetical protein